MIWGNLRPFVIAWRSVFLSAIFLMKISGSRDLRISHLFVSLVEDNAEKREQSQNKRLCSYKTRTVLFRLRSCGVT